MENSHDLSKFARGSAAELEYHLLLARDLHLLDETKWRKLDSMVNEIERMLTALVQRLQSVVVPKRTLAARSQRLEIASS